MRQTRPRFAGLNFARATAALVAIAILAVGCSTAREAPPLLLPANAEPSAIYDANGTLITTLREENRSTVSLDQIPRVVQDAVVAIEDMRFWEHNGVDPRSIVRAARSNADSGEVTQGGSTITQQYVKNALLSSEQTLSRKLEEASLAMALERTYSKELILELYLNTIYLGSGAYGVDAASQAYFGIPVRSVNLAQAALLAGIIQSPSRLDPRNHPEAALARRNLVLKAMLDQSLITRASYDMAHAAPISLAEVKPLPEQQPYPAAHFVDEVKDWLINKSDVLGKTPEERRENLLRGGLQISTTVDLGLQAKAEESIRSILPGQGSDAKTPDAALVSVDPKTGFVRAMVGGYNYFGTHSYRQLNLADGSGRQTGSAFKPIVYATALEAGVSPSKVFPSPASGLFKSAGKPWRVKGGGGLGAGTMHDCIVASSNTCFANIILDKDVGAQKSEDMAKRLGIVSTKLDATPAMVLGPNNTTVLDMANVYATFANDGIRVPPVFVTKITGANGAVIYQHAHTQKKAIEPEVARQVTSALEGVIAGGTGTAANIGRPAGGKTGSAQNNTDAWFCGFTPQLATAVWVGFAETRPDRKGVRRLVSMSPPNTRITVFGGTYPAKIWSAFMKQAMEGVFPTPLINLATAPVPTTTVPSPNPTLDNPVPGLNWVEVPDVTGVSLSIARQRLRNAGLEMRSATTPAGTGEPGRVTAQTPGAGGQVLAGSDVWVQSPAQPPATTTTIAATPDGPTGSGGTGSGSPGTGTAGPGNSGSGNDGHGKSGPKDKPKDKAQD